MRFPIKVKALRREERQAEERQELSPPLLVGEESYAFLDVLLQGVYSVDFAFDLDYPGASTKRRRV